MHQDNHIVSLKDYYIILLPVNITCKYHRILWQIRTEDLFICRLQLLHIFLGTHPKLGQDLNFQRICFSGSGSLEKQNCHSWALHDFSILSSYIILRQLALAIKYQQVSCLPNLHWSDTTYLYQFNLCRSCCQNFSLTCHLHTYWYSDQTSTSSCSIWNGFDLAFGF